MAVTTRSRGLSLALLVSLCAWSPVQAAVIDDFESYPLGAFPSPAWLDAGSFDPRPPAAPIPSARVVATTDAFGNPTRALAVVDAVALVAGIYQSVPVSTSYSLFADMRVDQYSDNPTFAPTDWAMQLTFLQRKRNFYDTPQAGIYASSLTQGWRVFLLDGTETLAADVDLGVPAAVGTWYRVAFDLNALTGGYRARIIDVATGTLLVDRVDAFGGWLAGSGPFDAVGFFDGEGGAGVTRSNLAVVDNINVRATPEPASLFLIVAGFAAMLAHTRRSGRALR